MGIHDGHREKMRRRYILAGLDAFAEHEILELLLFYAIPRKNTNPIAHALIDHYGSLTSVLSAPVEDLCLQPDIGESTAVFLSLLGKLKSRTSSENLHVKLKNTEEIAQFLLQKFSTEKTEVVYELCLKRNGNLLTCSRLGDGQPDRVLLDMRKMLRNALLADAYYVVLAHNHPGDDIPVPSGDDYAVTRQAERLLIQLGMVLQDHFVIAGGDYASMRESGFLLKEK